MDTESREGIYREHSYSEILPGFPVIWHGEVFYSGWCISYEGQPVTVARDSEGFRACIDELWEPK